MHNIIILFNKLLAGANMHKKNNLKLTLSDSHITAIEGVELFAQLYPKEIKRTSLNCGESEKIYYTNCHALIYNTRGDAKVHISKTSAQFPADSFTVLPAKTPLIISTDNEITLYVLAFTGRQSDNILTAINMSPTEPVTLSESHHIVSNLLAELISLLDNSTDHRDTEYASMLLWHLLAEFIFRDHYLNKTNTANIIEKSIEYMEKNLNHDLSLELLAANSGYSPAYFCSIFKEKAGESPITFFIKLKMQLAAEYLTQTGKSVKEISYLLGYSSQYYFSRLFKTHMGVSPSDFRNSNTQYQ